MELIDLVEASIVADFRTDDLLNAYIPREHDADMMKGDDDPDSPERLEQPFAITITAEDRGDVDQAPGSGIKKVGLEVEIEYNLGAEEERAGRTDLLAQLAERAGDRLSPTIYESERARVILNRLSNKKLKVHQVADEGEKRSDVDLTRMRVITRELVCAQLV